MREAVERLREKAQNEKTSIALSELLRLSKNENKALRAENERLKGEVARLRNALTKISSLYWTDAPYPDEMRDIARIALRS